MGVDFHVGTAVIKCPNHREVSNCSDVLNSYAQLKSRVENSCNDSSTEETQEQLSSSFSNPMSQ